MKTLQVSMENRVGCTLRGIVTLPETNEPVPFVLNLHGFAGSASRVQVSAHAYGTHAGRPRSGLRTVRLLWLRRE